MPHQVLCLQEDIKRSSKESCSVNNRHHAGRPPDPHVVPVLVLPHRISRGSVAIFSLSQLDGRGFCRTIDPRRLRGSRCYFLDYTGFGCMLAPLEGGPPLARLYRGRYFSILPISELTGKPSSLSFSSSDAIVELSVSV